MKKNFNNLSAIEKISILWTAPITLAVVILISIFTLIIYIFKVIFVFSGTIGSLQYLFGLTLEEIKRRQFKKLQRQDSEFSRFESLVSEKIKERQQRQQQ